MFNSHLLGAALALAAATLAPAVHAQTAAASSQTCEGGAYLNPQVFRGEAAYQRAVAEQEMRTFITSTGLPTAPLYSIKHIDEVTSSGRAPYCWIYSNPVFGLLSGYKPVVVNNELVQPAVLAITDAVAGAPKDGNVVLLKSLSEADQLAVLDKLKRTKCMGTVGGVEFEIVKTEGLCARVDPIPAQVAVGQQGLIARAAYEWDEQGWVGVATRESMAVKASTKGLAGRTEKVHQTRLISIPTKNTSLGFGLYVHPSVPDATIKKAASAFQKLASPSEPLAIALDLSPKFAFIIPTNEQIEKLRAAVGIRK
ncbi:MAG TPA: hypothetical protein VE934_06395 [Polaromonas sp.]|uniref:hypothetical protein n=1 Tax=Polaromonas sp. TaxID=1869339 RepID=UPI002D623660|nr:hypothetical protein [Polaromonas sp.]HYW56568.1 hypothetical protein [Polaromonas sp.]